MNIPKVKLSEKYIKGTGAERLKTARLFNEELFSRIYPLYKNTDFASIREIERIYKNFMPEPIYFKIKKLRPEEFDIMEGGLVTYYTDNKISSYRIELAANLNKFHISGLSTLMHESMHFFEHLLVPKFFNNSEKIRSRKLADLSNYIYTTQYYNWKSHVFIPTSIALKTIKYKTKHAVKNLNNEDKLLVLNHIKECLKREINAYKETQKYALILKSKGRKFRRADSKGYFKYFMFEKKVDVLNSLIYDTIKSERNSLPQNKTKSPVLRLREYVSNKLLGKI